MKFLCPQCKAKYQIADEKIERRTLRMKCRRCEFEIVVKGDAASVGAGAAGGASSEDAASGAASSAARPAAESAAPKAGPRAAGSALGADFRRQMSAGAASEPAKPAPPAPADAWHVAINEVPVGPMRRDEVGRKIASGAVDGESLCWREGFDDWRPVKDVAELAPLLRRPAAPAPGRPLPGPSKPGAAAGRAVAAGARPIAPATGPAGAAPAAAARALVAPIGGRLGAAAAPAFDERPEEFEENEATMVARSPLDAARSTAPEPAALAALVGASAPSSAAPGALGVVDTASPSTPGSLAAPPSSAPPAGESAFPSAFPSTVRDEPPRRRTPASPFVWVAAAGAVAFGVMLAILVAKNTLQPPPAPAPAVAAVAPAAPPVAPPQPLVIPEPAPVAPATTPVAPAVPVPVPAAATVPHRGGSKRPAAAAASGGRTLSAAEQAEIDRMTGGGAGGPNLAVPVRQMGGGGGGSSQGAELSAEQLRTVVQRNRPGLQHCYEMAARQTGSTESMRANVEVAVGGSGVVTRVSVTGNAPTQLTTCLESQVRRWHFPAGGEAAFPVVFSPGG